MTIKNQKTDYSEVAEPCKEYKAMLPDWNMVDAVYGGTRSMRAAGDIYLPKFGAESIKDYEARLKQTVLLNMLKKAIGSIVGKAFKKPVTLDDKTSDEFKNWAENIDREGRQLNVFAKDFFDDAARRGVTHFMVDFPRSTATTRAEQKKAGDRPYWVHMPAREIIGWKEEIKNGEKTLVQLRRHYTIRLSDGLFGEKEVERVTVYEPGKYSVYEKQKGGNDKKEVWALALDEALKEMKDLPTGVDYIPLVTFYTNRTGFMTAQPPLMDLAYKNVEHWQSSSDQRHILKWARFAIPYLTGFDPEEDNIKWGPSSAVVTKNDKAKVGFAEHTGAGIESGFKDLEIIKEEMAFLALEPMLRQTGNTTATARGLDEAGANSTLHGWVLGLKDAIENGLKFSGDRVGSKESAGQVSVNEEFTLSLQSESDAKIIMEAYTSGLIPKRVAQDALRKCGSTAIAETLEEYNAEDLEDMFEKDQRNNSAFSKLAGKLGVGVEA